MAGHTSEHVDQGELYIGIEYRYFNSGALDIHKLRSAEGIELMGSGKRYDVAKIFKSKKNVLLFVRDPKQLLDF